MKQIYINPTQVKRVVLQKESMVGKLLEKSGVWSTTLPEITYTGTYEGIVGELRSRLNLEVRNTIEVWVPTLLEVSYVGSGNPDTFKIDDLSKLDEIMSGFEGFINIR